MNTMKMLKKYNWHERLNAAFYDAYNQIIKGEYYIFRNPFTNTDKINEAIINLNSAAPSNAAAWLAVIYMMYKISENYNMSPENMNHIVDNMSILCIPYETNVNIRDIDKHDFSAWLDSNGNVAKKYFKEVDTTVMPFRVPQDIGELGLIDARYGFKYGTFNQ